MTADSNLVPIPRRLEHPPRSVGNAEQDLPIMIDWFWEAYQVILSSTNYINSQINNPEFSVANLPDPTEATTASAQQTANEAFNLANTATNNINATLELANESIERLNNFISGTFTISETDVGSQVIFTDPQPDNDYRVIVQPISFTGTPPIDAFVVETKTYNANSFDVIMSRDPLVGNSITFEWQLIRNT